MNMFAQLQAYSASVIYWLGLACALSTIVAQAVRKAGWDKSTAGQRVLAVCMDVFKVFHTAQQLAAPMSSPQPADPVKDGPL